MKRFVVLLTIPAVLLFAGNHGGMGTPGMGRKMHPMMEKWGSSSMEHCFEGIVDYLGLEGDALKKAEDLWYAHQKEMLDYRYKIEKARLELREYIASGKFSVNKIMEKWENIQKIKNTKEKKRMELRIAIFKLLPKEKQKEMGWWLIGGRMRRPPGHRGGMEMQKSRIHR